MHVDAQAALRRFLAQQAHALGAIGHRAFEVRNTADDFDAQVERAAQVVERTRRAQHTVLREGHQLQVQVRRNAALDLQQRMHGQQPVVANVNMAAYRQQPLRHGPVAVGQRALDQGLVREQRFQLAPQRNAFEQRAAGVDARQTVGQRGVHVEMRVDERRGQQQALGVDGFVGWHLQAGSDLHNAPVLNADRDVAATIGQGSVGDQQVKHGAIPLAQPPPRRAAPSKARHRGAECRGSRPAGAGQDGTKRRGLWPGPVQRSTRSGERGGFMCASGYWGAWSSRHGWR